MTRILIFTSHTGGGHMSLAEALRDRLARQASVTIVDPLPLVVQLHYQVMSRHALRLWGVGFHALNTPARAQALHQLVSLLLGRRLGTLLDLYLPDLVMSTYSLLTNAVLRALARRPRPTPFATLIADAHRLHAVWLTAQAASATLAPTQEAYQEALVAGFAPDRLHLTGWPVRAQFYRANHVRPAAVLGQLQLDPDRFTVFVQGGREGAARIADSVESILATELSQVILAAGSNQALHERFRDDTRVRVIPFTPEIAPLMAAADVVLGKAGPNMLFEAVTLGKPFIATTHVPGQETGNLDLIARYGLGWIALKAREQQALIAALVSDRGRLAAMAATVARYRAWNSVATEAIGRIAERLCGTPQLMHGSPEMLAGVQ